MGKLLYIIKAFFQSIRQAGLPLLNAVQKFLPFVILISGLAVTGLTTAYFAHTAEAQDRMLFQHEVTGSQTEIENRIATYVALLRATRALFNSNPNLSQEEFQAFVANLELRQRYPGLQGIGFAPRVPRHDVPQFLEIVRTGEQSDFNIFPDGVRNEYFPVLYLEPGDARNRAAIGYDLFSEQVIHDAMVQAGTEGTVASSGKVQLIQDADSKKQAGLLLFLPVYGPLADNTEVNRQKNLLGFVYLPLRAGDFFQSTLGGVSLSSIQTQVYDGPPQPENALRQLPVYSGARYTTTVRLMLAGRELAMECHTLPSFETQSRGFWTPFIGLTQLIITLLLFGLAYAETQARLRTEERSAQLRQNAEERARLLQSEQAARQTAEEANRAKDEFLALVSHELRTPLNSLAGWTRILRNSSLDEARRAHAIELIERNVKLQVRLTEELLDISQLVAGRFQLDLQPVAPQSVTRAAIENVRGLAAAKGIELSYAITNETGMVNADAARLQQILWNLLANAVKFTPGGGWVRLQFEQDKGFAQWTVSDNGQGIKPDFLPHIFKMFRQENNATTRNHSGLGLGLAIVQQLVKLHHGTITAVSGGIGCGSSFVVRLPLAVSPLHKNR